MLRRRAEAVVGMLAAAPVLLALACRPADAAGGSRERIMFELTSSAFAPSGKIPKKYTCDGKDVSPPLAWKGAPQGTALIAVIMEDPDAPAGTWIHWVIYDVPAASGALAENLSRDATLPDGATQGASWGVEKFDRVGYGGPCPPPGKPHRYFFRAYALSSKLALPAGAPKSAVVAAMKGKVLAEATLVGLYGR
jgi:Raf kinase inhibitor-like YbhB/YbcL family protein